MSSIKDQNKTQPILCREERESSYSFSKQEKKQLIDLYSLLLEWHIEDKNKENESNKNGHQRD